VLFVLINMLRTINLLKECAPMDRRETSVQTISKWVWLTLILYLLVTIGGELGFLYHVNAPNPKASQYVNTVSLETADIRQRLLNLGMPEYVLNDLPDNEARLFDGIYDASVSIMSSYQIVGSDDGKLEIILFDGFMPGGKVRTLCFYRWLELPKHTYTDLISIRRSLDYFAIPTKLNETSLSLYDMNGKTYSQALQNEGSAMIPAQHPYWATLTQIKFRLYPHYENQRGYVAIDTMVKSSQALVFDSYPTYVHQEHVWNRPYLDIATIPATFNTTTRANPLGPVIFQNEQFLSNSNYQPEASRTNEPAPAN